MKRSMTFTCAAVAAALLALPAQSLAQTPPATSPQPPAATQPQTTGTDSNKDAARQHLARATAALEDIETASLDAAAKKQVAELKRRINNLERSVAANDEASATGAAQRSERATAEARGAADWGTEVAAIDKTLTAMLGPDPATPVGTSGTTEPTGTAASAALDVQTRARLTDVRTAITAFATAMAGGEPSATTPAATSSPAGSQSTASPTTPPQTTPPAAQDPATPAPAQPAGQPDEQEARRHLTEARNTLSALTQLPAASQLSGEPRAQVSQLISNFNELISSQNNWKASYDKVAANLALLIGPDSAQPAPQAGTPGAVGTSGAVAVDPTIREKLLELRRQLSEFEKAASGGMTADPSATATPPPSSAPPSSTPPSSTPPSSVPPSSTPPSSAPPTGAPETTPTTQPPAGSQPAAGNAEIMRHIAAIEVLLKSEDDSGGLTLTKMQVEQLRTHWAALKAAIDKQ